MYSGRGGVCTNLESFLSFSAAARNDVSMLVQDGRDPFHPAESLRIQFHLGHCGGGKFSKKLHSTLKCKHGDLVPLWNSTLEPTISLHSDLAFSRHLGKFLVVYWVLFIVVLFLVLFSGSP